MESIETPLAFAIAAIMVAVAGYFLWRQQFVWRSLRTDPNLSSEHRRFLSTQITRRLFGSLILFVLGVMLAISSLFDYNLVRKPFDELPAPDQELARQAFRFLLFYWMTFLLLLMAMMALAVFDLWATARHGVWLRKQLLEEHQQALEAELTAPRHRRAEMN